MRKIISLFERNYDGDGLVRNSIVPGAEWVAAGKGIATRKWDGTCARVLNGKLYRRYDAKHGKIPPAGFEPAQDPDPKTGHWPGWLLIGDGPNDQYFREAFTPNLPDGTYELIGPKLQGNPEKTDGHTLIPHGNVTYPDCPRTFEAVREWLADKNIEGVVWHHPDGRMVKIKKRDFGLKR